MNYFPHPLTCDDEGLLAIGGDLSLDRLRLAYRTGVFPWYQEGPILWWYTHPRCIIYPSHIKVSKSMSQVIRNKGWRVTCDQAFVEVISSCAHIERRGQRGTWLNWDMKSAYVALHEAGDAHSIEVWEEDQLIGGLYGVVTGHIFCGESMFAHKSNASKVALIYLAHYLEYLGATLIDCQQDTPHVRTMGAELMSKEEYWDVLTENMKCDPLQIGDSDFREWQINELYKSETANHQ